MSSSALRWFVAATLAAALIAGLYLLAAESFSVRPGRTVEAVARLAGESCNPPERGEALTISGTRRVREPVEVERSAGLSNLGARLVESGRPREALSPLEAGELPDSAAASEPQPTPPGHIKPPAPTMKDLAASRARSVAAAHDANISNFAPQRRKIPARIVSDAKLRAVLKAPKSVPRLSTPAPAKEPPMPATKPEPGKPVALPTNNKRPPAPVVPLP